VRPDTIAAAAFEPGVADIDVAALHQGFLKRLRRRGGQLVVSAPVSALAFDGRAWTATVGGERWRAPIVVNAAGAWGDVVGAMA
ncbi:FAD-binding oxidoreductase, partial [Mycobacterium tuberculosis]|nr:FAD-binding oxidoreductase [Mycobacterium tuberculosis]